MSSNTEKHIDHTPGKADGAVREVMHKAGVAAGHFMEQAGERVQKAGELVGEAAINVGVRFEQAGDKLKAVGKKLASS